MQYIQVKPKLLQLKLYHNWLNLIRVRSWFAYEVMRTERKNGKNPQLKDHGLPG